MKKLLFLLLFVCSAAAGQMTITKEYLPIGISSRNLWCKKYIAKIPTNNWLIWLEGLGELGPADGSQLDKVELFSGTTPVTWTAQAAKGFEFPFNIIAIQLPTGWDYWAIQNSAATYVKETLKANEVGVTGYSLGGRGCWTVLNGDSKGYISFIAPVCGYYDFSQGPITALHNVAAYGVHGSLDTTMPYSYDIATQTQYNVNRPTQLIAGATHQAYYLQTIIGAGHSVWPAAYDLTPGKDGLYQWVIQQFGPPMPDPIVSWNLINGILVGTTQSGKTINITPGSIN